MGGRRRRPVPGADRRYRAADAVHRRRRRSAAPRLAQLRPDPDELRDLWDQLAHNLSLLALAGYAHGDLSAYNLLVHDGRLVVIDVPQIVDVVGNPRGREFLDRDVRNVGGWFTARGLDPGHVDALSEALARDARLA